MSLAKKLQVKPAVPVCVLNAPDGFTLDAELTDDAAEGAVLAFATTRAELEAHAEPALAAAREDRLAWIAYPKAKQLGTDLNRDLLWEALKERGVRPVRQVSLDDVWSALRFRPA